LQRILALATYIVCFKESKVSQHTKPYQKIASTQKNTANVPLISSKLLKQKLKALYNTTTCLVTRQSDQIVTFSNDVQEDATILYWALIACDYGN
jgi:hypothetical protein